MLIYFLSVVGDVKVVLLLGGGFTGTAAAIVYLSCRAERNPGGAADARKVCLWALASMCVGLLFPHPRDVIQAYAMVEGAKVVTADNAEAAAAGAVKRVDALIEALGSK